MKTSREIQVSPYTSISVEFETDRYGCDTKVKITSDNEDGTIICISSEDIESFTKELDKLLLKYFI